MALEFANQIVPTIYFILIINYLAHHYQAIQSMIVLNLH